MFYDHEDNLLKSITKFKVNFENGVFEIFKDEFNKFRNFFSSIVCYFLKLSEQQGVKNIKIFVSRNHLDYCIIYFKFSKNYKATLHYRFYS